MAETTVSPSLVQYVASLRQLIAEAHLQGDSADKRKPGEGRLDPSLAPVLLFSPHPDDESITGLLPLRLFEEEGRRVINVALTLGSKRERRAARDAELAQACGVLGFEVEHFQPGCENPERLKSFRSEGGSAAADLVDSICRIVEHHRPALVLYPHGRDRHPAHEGASRLVEQALRRYSLRDHAVVAVESECWQAQAKVDLAVEGSVLQVGRLCQAIQCHQGEVARNPYHVRQPVRMLENGFRASEMLAGFGSPARSVAFCELYSLFRFQKGKKYRSREHRFHPQSAAISMDRLLAGAFPAR